MKQSSKAIVYEADGKTLICFPVTTLSDPLDFTEEDAIARALSDIPAGASTTIVDRADIPADRTFRDALKADLTHDMEKCRGIWQEKMRRERVGKLAALDVEYQRADESGDASAKQRVAKKKQELRDVTDHPGIAVAQTPEELKAVWPGVLEA